MTFRPTMTAVIALACGGLIAAPPAFAQQKKKAEAAAAEAGPQYDLTKEVRDALAAAQAAQQAGDLATANAKIAEAQAGAKTEDDKFVAASIAYDLARASNDQAKQLAAVDAMLASGRVPQDRQGSYYMVQAQGAYNANDFQKAETALAEVIRRDPNNRDVYPVMVETKVKLNKPQEAVQVLDQAITTTRAANQPVPEQWYKRGLAIAYKANLPAETTRFGQSWIAAYPTAGNWADVLSVYRDLNRQMDPAQQTDFWRLKRATGSLRGEPEYMAYVTPLYVSYPGEADAVLKEGVSKGVLNANSSALKSMSGAAAKAKTARGELPAAAAEAKKSDNGKTALATGDAYLGFGDYAPAAEMYRLAIQKGQVDANVANTRLGMALAMSGQGAEAKQALASVTGPRADLAKYWSLYADTRGGAAATPAAPAAPAAAPAQTGAAQPGSTGTPG